MLSLRNGLIMSSVAVVAVAMFACGKKDDSKKKDKPGGSPNGALAIEFSTEAANSLPQVTEAPTFLGLTPPSNITDIFNLKNFFRQECYMPNDAGTSYQGFCPDTVKAQLNAAIAAGTGVGTNTPLFSQYKLSSTTLIGLIYHAEMYSHIDKLSNTCSENGATALATANTPAFSSGETGGTPEKYVVTYPTGSKLFSCVKANTFNGETTYTTFGYENNAINVLTARYGLPYGSTPDKQTDIFQIYLALKSDTVTSDSPTPTFLAFNHPSAAGARAIVLSNLVEHKFAAKYQWGTNPIIAVGTGGVNTDGTPVTGYYLAYDAETTTTYCVNNTDGSLEVQSDTSGCSSDATLKAAWDTMNADTVATFLGMSATDKAAAVNYLGFFDSNTTAFEVGERPTSGCNDGDNTCYAGNKKDFPNKIE